MGLSSTIKIFVCFFAHFRGENHQIHSNKGLGVSTSMVEFIRPEWRSRIRSKSWAELRSSPENPYLMSATFTNYCYTTG